jgi:SAM-dependent methyltransferase
MFKRYTNKDQFSNIVNNKEQLEIAEKAGAFTNWMYSEIKPFLRGDILEVGSGIGTYSRKIVNDFKESKTFFSDIDPEHVRRLSALFNKESYPLISIIQLDLTNPGNLSEKVKFDSIFALNVIEHISDDVMALNSIYNLLKPGGVFIMLVPAHQFLYNCMDEAAGHYRRYNKKNLSEKISKTRFKIRKMYYFNFFSIFGWYINGKIFKKPLADESALGLFNKITPLAKFIEKYFLMKRVGISIITVLEK